MAPLMATMLRPCACALLAAAAAAAQTPDAFVALLRDPAGRPVVGAAAAVEIRPAGELAALRDLVPAASPLAAAVPQPTFAAATSDARGELRFPAGDGVSASGWVATADGLGALLVELRPGRAQRVAMAPMAAVTTATGTEPLRVHARATMPDGRTVTFAPPPGASVALPAGDHELWVHSADGWLWCRRQLASGERFVVTFAGRTLRVQTASPATLHPAGRPDVALCAPGADEALLCGDAVDAPLLAFDGQAFHGPRILSATTANAVAWPTVAAAPPTIEVSATALPATAPAALFSLRQRGNGTWEVLAASLARADREPAAFAVPQPAAGDTWLLLVAAGHAPQALPWLPGGPVGPFAAARGAPLIVHVRDASGDPLDDVVVDYTPADMPPAMVVGRSDGRGIVRLGRAIAPGTLRISDPRWANEDLELAAIPGDGITIVVRPGAALRGVATWADGAPAGGVLVTLRDATGRLRPAQRTAISGDDGSFAFFGLPEQRPLLLFATALRDGRTWSGKLDRLLAGGEPAALVLRDEDPDLLPGR
jgi:hypothetical protein